VSLAALEEALGHRFARAELLELALTHSSSAQDDAALPNNDRLEYLGDAVLDLVVAQALFAAHPDWREGELTWTRAALVRSGALAERARALGLGPWIRLGKSERQGGGAEKDSILANVLEAVVGAVYLDGGLEAARALVERVYGDALAAEAAPVPRDAKMRFQEWAHRRFRVTPTWRIVRDSGDDGDPTRFEAEACVGEETFGRGSARTKRDAERAAAQDALARAGDESPGC
jgi:ribonuclease-3